MAVRRSRFSLGSFVELKSLQGFQAWHHLAPPLSALISCTLLLLLLQTHQPHSCLRASALLLCLES